jgi:guanine nucleotide-binding protein subunit alpha
MVRASPLSPTPQKRANYAIFDSDSFQRHAWVPYFDDGMLRILATLSAINISHVGFWDFARSKLMFIQSYRDNISGTDKCLWSGENYSNGSPDPYSVHSLTVLDSIMVRSRRWQYLEEDQRTNRIHDSLQLFTAICSNKLLKSAHLVLLLNKAGNFCIRAWRHAHLVGWQADLLKKKLEAGIKVRK